MISMIWKTPKYSHKNGIHFIDFITRISPFQIKDKKLIHTETQKIFTIQPTKKIDFESLQKYIFKYSK